MSQRPLAVGRELVLLLVVAAVLHAVVLCLVFPGYYRPLWPNHSDFYIAPALAHSGFGIADYVRFPRPVAMLFFGAIGMLGINGTMLLLVTLAVLNLVLIASLVRRALGLELSLAFVLAFAGYSLLVFAHPYFYRFATYDAVSQLSLLLLLLAAACWMRAWSGQRSFPWEGLAFVLCLLAFLAKETYGPSALVVAAAAGVGEWLRRRYKAFMPLASALIALVSGLALNRLNGSPFTGAANAPDSPYRIDLSSASLIGQYLQYASDGLNGLTIAALVGAIMIVLASKDIRIRWAVVVLPVAGVLAWLPNSALPNHHDAGYSWGAAGLLFIPFLLLPLTAQAAGRRWLAFAGVALAFVGFLVNGPGPGSQWVLEQEARQRRLLQDIERLVVGLPQGGSDQRILVTGIDFPYSPFDHGLALRSIGPVERVHFDVVRYVASGPGVAALPQLNALPSGVRFVAPDEADPASYAQVWAFRSNGSLVRRALPADYEALSRSRPEAPSANPLIYPSLLDVFKPGGPLGPQEQGYRLLSCGVALLVYENLNAAQSCLERSVALIPDNPYPAYYLGQLNEKQRRFVDARRWYERAVETDDRKAPNPAFHQAVKRVVGAVSITE